MTDSYYYGDDAHFDDNETPHDSREDGHCFHSVYVGGMGPDWMCGPCEDGETEQEYLEAKLDAAVRKMTLLATMHSDAVALGASSQLLEGIISEVKNVAATYSALKATGKVTWFI